MSNRDHYCDQGSVKMKKKTLHLSIDPAVHRILKMRGINVSSYIEKLVLKDIANLGNSEPISAQSQEGYPIWAGPLLILLSNY
jgi:hypothetical protein